MTGVLRRGENRDTQAQREGGCVKTEAGIRVMLPGAQGRLEPLAAARGEEGSSPRVFRGSRALPTPES